MFHGEQIFAFVQAGEENVRERLSTGQLPGSVCRCHGDICDCCIFASSSFFANFSLLTVS